MRRGDLSSNLTLQLDFDGTAEALVDYLPQSTTLEFLPGESESILTLTPLDDLESEGSESIHITLSSVATRIGAGSISVYLADDEVSSVRARTSALLQEGEPARLSIERDSCAEPSSLEFTLSGLHPEDFAELPTGVQFAADQAVADTTLVPLADEFTEGREHSILAMTLHNSTFTTGAFTEQAVTTVDTTNDLRLAAWWRMSAGPGGVEEQLHGTKAPTHPMGATGPQPSSSRDHALEFDGVDDLVLLPGPILGEAFTMVFSFRAEPQANPGYRYLMGQGTYSWPNSLSFYLDDNSLLRAAVRGGGDSFEWSGLTDSNFQADGAWHHVALSVDASIPQAKLYVDGLLKDTQALGAGGIASGYNLYLGNRPDLTAQRYFAGGLADIQIYSAVLTAEEIAEFAP